MPKQVSDVAPTIYFWQANAAVGLLFWGFLVHLHIACWCDLKDYSPTTEVCSAEETQMKVEGEAEAMMSK